MLRKSVWDQENILLETDAGTPTVAHCTHRPQGGVYAERGRGGEGVRFL